MNCPGTPRPDAEDILAAQAAREARGNRRRKDRRNYDGMVFGLGGSLDLVPGPSPRSPALGIPTPDRAYRSLFQQPAIEIQPAHAAHSWFDFLLNPQKLVEQTRVLLVDSTQTPTAQELISDFLRKASQSITASIGMNALSGMDSQKNTGRHNALMRLAALVVLQLRFTLDDIEAQVPTNLQKSLLDGLVDLAKDPRDTLQFCDSHAQDISLDEALVLRYRWMLRIFVRKHHVCQLTIPSKMTPSDITNKQMPDEVEQLNSIYLPPFQQVAEDLEKHLSEIPENSTKLAVVSRLSSYIDLGIYYFHAGLIEAVSDNNHSLMGAFDSNNVGLYKIWLCKKPCRRQEAKSCKI